LNADPDLHFNADPDTHFNADPDLAPNQGDADLQPLVYRVQTLQASILNFDFNADPDPAFLSNADPDPDPTSKNNAATHPHFMLN
jgi:hypothetical protein